MSKIDSRLDWVKKPTVDIYDHNPTELITFQTSRGIEKKNPKPFYSHKSESVNY